VRMFVASTVAAALLGCGHRRAANDLAPTPASDGGAAMKTPKEECEALMSAVVPFAQRMLSQYREFYPFGGAMGTDGKIVEVGASTGSEHPASQDLVALLEAGFREGARTGRYRATALVIDMLVVPPGKTDKQDAFYSAATWPGDGSPGDAWPSICRR
jgi:hypothetical protein